MEKIDSFDNYLEDISFTPISKGLGFAYDHKAVAKAGFTKHKLSQNKENFSNWDPDYQPLFVDPTRIGKSHLPTPKKSNRPIMKYNLFGRSNDKSARRATKSIVPKRRNSRGSSQIKVPPKIRDPLYKSTPRPRTTKKLSSLEYEPQNIAPNIFDIANPLIRFLAFGLDLILILGVFSLSLLSAIIYVRYTYNTDLFSFSLTNPVWQWPNLLTNVRTLATNPVLNLVSIFGFLLFLFYLTFFTLLIGATPGKILFNIRQVNSNGNPVGLFQTLKHNIAFLFTMPTAIQALFNQRYQTYYDKVCDVLTIKQQNG